MPLAAALSKALSARVGAEAASPELGGPLVERLQPALRRSYFVPSAALLGLEDPLFGGFDVRHGVYHSRALARVSSPQKGALAVLARFQQDFGGSSRSGSSAIPPPATSSACTAQSGSVQVGAVGEPATVSQRLAHLAEGLRKRRRLEGAQPKLVDPGAIDQEPGIEAIGGDLAVVVWRPRPYRETSRIDDSPPSARKIVLFPTPEFPTRSAR